LTGALVASAGCTVLGRRPYREPVFYADKWAEQHLCWPLERTLLAAFPDLEGWARRPRLAVARDYQDPASEGVTIWLPPWWHVTREVKQRLVSIVGSRLNLPDPVATWTLSGPQPKVVIRARAKLPESLHFAEVREQITGARDTAPIIGLAAGGQLVVADLEDDSPHILISAGSGGGKSALTRLLAAQALHNGANVVICDFKRTSHNWAKGLPGVTYCRRIDEIHHALVALAAISEERNERAEYTIDVGPPIWVVLEELNATAEKLRDFWDMTRDKSEPKRSPAIMGMKDLLFMGRSARVHVVAIAQRLEANLVGGGSGRENFALRCLCRFTPQTWQMLAADAGRPPRRGKVPGRWHIVSHGVATETQVILVSELDAQSWALTGRPVPPVAALSELARTYVDMRFSPNRVAHTATTPVGLREAAAKLEPPLSLAALRKHSERDARFPPPAGEVNRAKVWHLSDLARWRKERAAGRDG
jgi:hypothetical protein